MLDIEEIRFLDQSYPLKQAKSNYKSDFEMRSDSDKNEKNTASKLIGSKFDDRLVGGNSNDKLNGKKGADIYVLSSGRDEFKGF